MTEVRALLAGRFDGNWERRVASLPLDELGAGEVLVRVQYSGINFKDGLASTETGRVARLDPIVPGIDLAGVVEASDDPTIAVGSSIIAHGYDLGVAHHGGYASHARVPAAWVVPMPAGLDARTAMLIGTAGYTAALSVAALEQHGLVPGSGPVLVTGASGGVGSVAVGMLAARGHHVVASTGKLAEADWLRSIGAAEVIDRAELTPESPRPLDKERWAGAVDCVGGATLAHVLRTLKYDASVAASGLTGGTDLPTTVLPFILRGTNLLGIDSVQNPIAARRALWQRIGDELKPTWLDSIDCETVGLDDLAPQLDRILAGAMRGRVLVDPTR
ncbi:MAG: acryloyl-CoA reductase [Actinobacteria bacterium]|nr:acryloyl-CoA reductase [Actinomycetota bacterium]